MKEVLVFAFSLLGCGAPATPVVSPETSACFAAESAVFWAEIEKCKAEGKSYDQCDGDRLASELSAKLEACP